MMLIKLFLFFLLLLILPDICIYTRHIYAVFPKNGHIGLIGFPVCFFYWE